MSKHSLAELIIPLERSTFDDFIGKRIVETDYNRLDFDDGS